MFLLTLFVLTLLLKRVSKESGDKNSVRLGTVLEWETDNTGGRSKVTAEVRPSGTMMELGAPNISPHTHTQRCDGVGVGG